MMRSREGETRTTYVRLVLDELVYTIVTHTHLAWENRRAEHLIFHGRFVLSPMRIGRTLSTVFVRR